MRTITFPKNSLEDLAPILFKNYLLCHIKRTFPCENRSETLQTTKFGLNPLHQNETVWHRSGKADIENTKS